MGLLRSAKELRREVRNLEKRVDQLTKEEEELERELKNKRRKKYLKDFIVSLKRGTYLMFRFIIILIIVIMSILLLLVFIPILLHYISNISIESIKEFYEIIGVTFNSLLRNH